jgi:hypothetical protein
MPSYISLFSVNAVGSLKLLAKLLGNLRLSKLAPQKRAIVMVLILLAVTSILGGIAATTPHAYTPMVLLGVFYGVVFSYPVITFLSPSIQSAAGGFLGGITTSSIATKLTLAKTWVATVGAAIASLVKTLPIQLNTEMSAAITYCIWMTIVTTLLIVVVNVYYSHSNTSNIGNQVKVEPPPPPAIRVPVKATGV